MTGTVVNQLLHHLKLPPFIPDFLGELPRSLEDVAQLTLAHSPMRDGVCRSSSTNSHGIASSAGDLWNSALTSSAVAGEL